LNLEHAFKSNIPKKLIMSTKKNYKKIEQ